MKNWLSKFKSKSRWTLTKERRALVERAKKSSPDQEDYEPTLKNIEIISRIQNEKAAAVMNGVKVIGTLGIMGILGYLGYKMDSSDGIPRNRTSQGLFNRFFKN